jgi:hypothetical protein
MECFQKHQFLGNIAVVSSLVFHHTTSKMILMAHLLEVS